MMKDQKNKDVVMPNGGYGVTTIPWAWLVKNKKTNPNPAIVIEVFRAE